MFKGRAYLFVYLWIYFKTAVSDGEYDDFSGVLASIMPEGDPANLKLSTGYSHYSGCDVLMLISLSIWERRVIDVCGMEGF